jgi:hypothetical protein
MPEAIRSTVQTVASSISNNNLLLIILSRQVDNGNPFVENGFLLFQTALFWTMELSLNDFMDSAPPFVKAPISSYYYEVRMDISADKAVSY